MTGIYIHVPFCLRKCPYCDFYSVRWSAEAANAYVNAVLRNIESYAEYCLSADTIYFGGGTPSLLTAEQINSILSAADKSFNLLNPEITIECNPSSSYYEKLYDYRSAGVNRLSFGVQSADDSELKGLGRLHTFERACIAVNGAVKAGYNNISCDIMLGLCGQSLDSLRYSVERISSLPVSHISAYMLKIEENTPYNCAEVKSSAADDELMSDMYLNMINILEDRGFMQYEISNFAKPGMESRHNLKYWQGEEYIGIGPASHSFFCGKRYKCPDDIESFIESRQQSKKITEESPNKLEEYIMLGLRLKRGVLISRIAELGGNNIAYKAAEQAGVLEKHGLCIFNGERIYLTPEGFLVSNEIIARFLDL